MFELCSRITIDGKKFGGVNEIKIKRSIHELAATATIKVPQTAILKQNGKPATEIDTAKAIKISDPVEIKLGYNNSYNMEFTGYVKQINLGTPLEIVCEDEFFLTRERSVTMSGKTTLPDILQKCGLQAGTAIELTLEAFQVPEQTVAWVLSKLKTDYKLSVFFDLAGKVYVIDPTKREGGEIIKYTLRDNVIKDDELQYENKEGLNLKVIATCTRRDGSIIEATAGKEGGTVKKLCFYDIEDEKELKKRAEAELEHDKRYTGKIQTFLFPYAEPGMIAEISDPVYKERDGKYYVESVETTYDKKGARRSIEIVPKE